MNQNSKVVVFGGSGFLGSHVSDALTKAGYKIVIYDKQESPWINSNQEMLVHDILNEKKVIEAIAGAKAVYHFAGIADIQEANDKPIEAVRYNILGATNILEACVEHKVERFIFASSVYVYSEHGGFYRSTKQACELLIENYQKLYDVDFTILRFGSLYGRRSNKFNWIRDVIKQALTEGKMQRRGNGKEVREYVHVNDAAQACVDILKEKYKNQYLIISGSYTIKVKELLGMINEMMSNKIEIKYLDERVEGHYEITPYSFRPRLAKKYFGNTEVDLGQGLLDTIYDVYKELKSSDDDNPIISLPDEN